MFKKPLGQLKTSAPIRASDRRKLKQRVVTTFSANPEDGDLLVPDGILTAKFFTYAKEPGNLYLDPSNGNPLWFTIGKGSEYLIPTVYTLWKLKHSNLLPCVLTPSAVIPILVGGADLMIPGVITHSPTELTQNQLVAIHQLSSEKNADETVTRIVSPPLAVGRMAVSSSDLKAKSDADEKGKAVLILHTWKDRLWEMGQKVEPIADEADTVPKVSYTPQEITELLNTTLIHAIATQLSSLPVASFPIPASQLYATYLLPCRPAYPTSLLLPSAATADNADVDPAEVHIDPSEITIKSSSHKSLTAFLKAVEKSSLLTLKAAKQKSGGGDLLITSVNTQHPDVVSYVTTKESYVTVAEVEAKRAKRQAREEQADKERERSERAVEIRQAWKPHLRSLGLFEDMGTGYTISTSDLYSLDDIRTRLNDYFTSRELINKRDKAYINLNPPLLTLVEEKTPLEFMKRDELMKKVVEQMQGWYEVKAEGRDVVTSKGEIKPIRVEMKSRQGGRRGITTITGFEPFLSIDADDMAEKFRKICAGSTSVSPYQVPGTNQQRLKVVVQGKQSKPIVEYLIERGVPKKWIEVTEVLGKK
ncbi:Eukaryotic translation initiation factor 2D [Leucoagaricus sp. SymC.cos]|nr:Eukaryotic translation initiation factor 2D [Leucoagaricus sp. SymC.cos]